MGEGRGNLNYVDEGLHEGVVNINFSNGEAQHKEGKEVKKPREKAEETSTMSYWGFQLDKDSDEEQDQGDCSHAKLDTPPEVEMEL
ncbi:hypothetical protein NL676_034326 [Syzygium grande]|nr:hypothetical protein NL676_034326 [Syzygium grande]